MNLSEVVRALLRRWYLVVLGVLAAGALGYLTLQAVPPSYEARASVLLLPPGYDANDGSNPFLALGGLELPASVLTEYLDGDAARAVIAQEAPDATYTVEVDASTRGPVLTILVEDPTAAGALHSLDTVLASVPQALDDLQNQLNVPAGASIGSMPLAVDAEATVVTKATMRAFVAAVGVCLLATVFGTVGVDVALRRWGARRARRARHSTPTAADAADESTGRPAAPPASRPDPAPEAEAEAEHRHAERIPQPISSEPQPEPVSLA
jgi:hypothetical protein